MDITRQVLLVKVEPSYGVDAAPTVTDAILAENLSVSRDNLKVITRTPIEASKGTRQDVVAASLYAITFDVEVKGSGTAGTAPEIGACLLGCGLDETVVASTSVTYGPVSTGQDSVTIWRYIDGKAHKFTGCRGNFTYKMTTHDKLMMSFSFIGRLASYSDLSMITPTYDTTIPQPILNAALTVDAVAHKVNELTMDHNNEIKIPTDMSASDGFGEVSFGKRTVSGSFDPEEVLNAVYDFRATMNSNAAFALSLAAIGATAGNIITSSMPNISFVDDGEGDRENKVIRQMNYKAYPSAGDDDFAIAFT